MGDGAEFVNNDQGAMPFEASFQRDQKVDGDADENNIIDTRFQYLHKFDQRDFLNGCTDGGQRANDAE